MTIAYDSPAAIKTFLEAEGLAMSKRFGQNFLVDRNAREKLCAAVESAVGTSEPRHIWEIGPGIGSITSLLLEKGHRVTAFEIDHGFARILRDLFGDNPRFTLVEGDVLKTWQGQLAAGLPDIVFGNLPYNVALAIVGDLLESGTVPARMVFTVQKEAAQRIVSSPGTKDYSSFSVLCLSVCKGKILYDIGASAFWPRPRVTSSVISLAPRPDPVAASDRAGFSRFVRGAFASRRKTLRNNLAALDARLAAGLAAALAERGIAEDIRAEALTPEQLSNLYFALAAGRGAPEASPALPCP